MSKDTIYRQDAIDALIAIPDYGDGVVFETLSHALRDIALLPSAQPERKRGKWIYKNHVWFCSECGENPTKGMGYVQGHDKLYDFCPNCGADMRKPKLQYGDEDTSQSGLMSAT